MVELIKAAINARRLAELDLFLLSGWGKLTLRVQELLVLLECRASAHGKQILLVAFIFLFEHVVLDENLLVLLLQQRVAVNFLLEILSESLVGKEQFVNGALLLVASAICVFVRLNDALELFNLLAHGRLFGPLFESLFLALALFLKFGNLDALLFNDALELLHNGFELLSGAVLFGLEFDRVSRLLRKRVSSEFLGVIADLLKLLFVLLLKNGRELRSLQFVVLEVSDSLLETGILKVEGLLLELEVKQTLFCPEHLFLHVAVVLLVGCELISQHVDLLLLGVLACFACGYIVSWSVVDQPVDFVLLLAQLSPGKLQFLLSLLLLLHELGKLDLQLDLDGLGQLLVDILQVEDLVLELHVLLN